MVAAIERISVSGNSTVGKIVVKKASPDVVRVSVRMPEDIDVVVVGIPGLQGQAGIGGIDYAPLVNDGDAVTPTDNSTLLQTFIDSSIYGPKFHQQVDVNDGSFFLGRTVHLGYGSPYPLPSGPSFRAVRMSGRGTRFAGDAPFNGTKFVIGHTTGPGIAFQGGRYSEIRDLILVGKNRDWLYLAGTAGNSPDQLIGFTTTIDGTDITKWTNPALTGANANYAGRYTPYAGVAVDPYFGDLAANTPQYLPPVYPAGFAQSQGNKSPSDHSTLTDVHIMGFYVGVVTMPQLRANQADGNGDFLNLWRPAIQYCVYGICPSQTQSRNVAVWYPTFLMVHTCLNNKVFGKQLGECDSVWYSPNINACVQLFDLDSSGYAGPFKSTGGNGELCYRFGSLGSGGTAQAAAEIDGLRLDMQVGTAMGVPATLCDGGTRFVLRNGIYIIPDITSIDSPLVCEGVKWRNAYLENLQGATTFADRKSGNVAAGGGALPRLLNIADRPQSVQAVTFYHDVEVSVGLSGDFTTGTFNPSNGRRSTVPWVIKPVTISYQKTAAGPYPGCQTSTTGIVSTITFPTLGDIPIQMGDVVEDDVTVSKGRVTSSALNLSNAGVLQSCTCSVTWLNNIRQVGGVPPWSFRTALSNSTGNYYVLRSGVYKLVYETFGDIIAGDPVIRNVRRMGDFYNLYLDVTHGGPQPGDILLGKLDVLELPDFVNPGTAPPTILAVTLGNGVDTLGTITLTDGAAVARTAVGVNLGYFMRIETQPVPAFVGDTVRGVLPYNVNFTYSGTLPNPGATFLWEKTKTGTWAAFANQPTAKNPTNEPFASGPPWSVRVTVTDYTGSVTHTRDNYIQDTTGHANVDACDHFWRLNTATSIQEDRVGNADGKSDQPDWSVAVVTGHVTSRAVAFPGETGKLQRFSAADIPSLRWDHDLTFAFWTNNGETSPASENFRGLFGKGTASPAFDVFDLDPYHGVRAQFGAASALLTPASAVGVPLLYVVTFDVDGGTNPSTGKAWLYIGSPGDTSPVLWGSVDNIPALTDLNRFTLGGFTGSNTYLGWMEQVGIWGRLFTGPGASSDIDYLWNAGSGQAGAGSGLF